MSKKRGVDIFTLCIILGTIFSGVLLIYSFTLGHLSQPHNGAVEKIYSGIFSGYRNIGGEQKVINKNINISGELSISQNKSTLFESNYSLVDGYIYSDPDFSQQSLGGAKIEYTTNNISNTQTIGPIDIISEDEDIFINFGKKNHNTIQKLIDYLYENNIISNQYKNIGETILSTNKSGDYGYINNTQVIGKALGNIENNGIIYKIISSFVSGDTYSYMDRSNLITEIKEYLYKDEWIDVLFTQLKNEQQDKDIKYKINPDICNQFGGIINQFSLSSSKEEGGLGNKISNCKKSINEFNPFFLLLGQAYKTGDIENGNYDFVVSQGSNIEIRLTYARHILQERSIFIQDKEKNIFLSMIGDKFKINESQFKLDYSHEDSYIQGEIENGNGSLDIYYGKDEKIIGKIVMQDYFLTNIDIDGKTDIDGNILSLLLLGDYRTGTHKIGYNTIDVEFSYNSEEKTFDYVSDVYGLNMSKIGDSYIAGFSEQNTASGVIKEGKLIYDTNRISLFYNNIKNVIDISINDLGDNNYSSKLQVKNNKQNVEIDIYSDQKSDILRELDISGYIDSVKLLEGTIEFIKKEDEKKYIQGDLKFIEDDIDIDFEMDIEMKEGVADFYIPNNALDISPNIYSAVFFPSFHNLQSLGTQFYTFGIKSTAIFGGTLLYMDNNGESREERNRTYSEYIEKLNTLIKRYIDENPEGDLFEIIGEVKSLERDIFLKVGGEKIFQGEEYKVGNINKSFFKKYDISENELNLEEYADIEIAVLDKGIRKTYQILGYLDETGKNKQSIIVGNYNPRDFIRYNFELSEDEKNLIIIDEDNHFRIGDNTNLGTILDINNGEILLDSEIKPGISKIYLLGNDSPSLFINKGKPVINGVRIKK